MRLPCDRNIVLEVSRHLDLRDPNEQAGGTQYDMSLIDPAISHMLAPVRATLEAFDE